MYPFLGGWGLIGGISGYMGPFGLTFTHYIGIENIVK
jgi:hypothetical protein